ncbi:Mannose-6-phosphate isomerase, cupin superfamily [Sinosporangium album]|uniref:Mannose-6-phosphate isomerase, cupin superfamily n=1 Tax=Sinosporangium album TaxID=504805 RepID=A0A1G8KY61_9ACTN|nr:cupin domain-containing protein [Sinosporangium album]SDI48364.1 Mannose-6-phosphate isomerase, cupin superfamily [Sinosporangium album]
MTLIRTASNEKLNAANRPPGCPVHSAGRFRLRATGTSRFDRHYHDFDEFWFVASGAGTFVIGDTVHQVQPGDIVYTPAGVEHDIVAVSGEQDLEVFWLSCPLPSGADGRHLHRTPEDAAKHQVPSRVVPT